MKDELQKIYEILVSFLGEAKDKFDGENMQLQFACPKCIDRDGKGEARKYNLEVNLKKQVYQCWKCSSMDDSMKGPILRLIKEYGGDSLTNDYKSIMRSIRSSELYRLGTSDDFIDTSAVDNDELTLPTTFKPFKEGKPFPKKAMAYLEGRGIGWDIINEYHIGFTERETEHKKQGFRIVIPSYDVYDELNYWVGRDYLPKSDKFVRLKYDNPKVEKRSIIFNEGKLQWDADINLVEGPFDHIVVPNSVPLLGKALNKKYKLYWDLLEKANANVNIFLDGDAFDTTMKLYSFLNHDKFYGRVRYIPMESDEDPSSLYQKGGKKAILTHLANARTINEAYL